MIPRHSHQFCGQPCTHTTGSPDPASATCRRTPRASTQWWRTPASSGSGRLGIFRKPPEVAPLVVRLLLAGSALHMPVHPRGAAAQALRRPDVVLEAERHVEDVRRVLAEALERLLE